jgi:hypothetical protein
MDLADRQPLDPVHPPDLRPLLHADHPLLLARPNKTKRGSKPDRTPPAPHRVGHFSTGTSGSVFRRRPHRRPG